MLNREKDIYIVFTQAMIRNLAFLRIQSGLHLITEFVNDSYGDYKPQIMKRIPESLHGTPTCNKFEESPDAYDLIDSLTDTDIPPLVDNIKSLPYGKQIEDAVPEEYLDPDILSFFLPDIKEAVHLIKETPLYQDVLVSAVTAFEVYLRDTLHDLIVNNGEIAKKFEAKVKAQLNIDEDLELHRSTKQLIAHQITKYSSFYRVSTIESLYQKCFYKPGKASYRMHTSNNKLNSLQYYLTLRHLLVHKGGIVDHKFLKDTKSDCKYPLGEQHPVLEKHVDEFIGLTQGIAKRIEEEIKNY